MKLYLKMKYEMFMMGLFDWIVGIMKANDRLSWYIDFATGSDIKIHDLELKIDSYEDQLMQKDERIDELEDALYYFHEPLGES